VSEGLQVVEHRGLVVGVSISSTSAMYAAGLKKWMPQKPPDDSGSAALSW